MKEVLIKEYNNLKNLRIEPKKDDYLYNIHFVEGAFCEIRGAEDTEFAKDLVTWADVIRKTFYDGGVDEVISTRRLDHIVKAFAIFGNKMQAIELCVARFDEDTKVSFLDLYTKIDAGIDVGNESEIETDDPDTFERDMQGPAF